MAEEATTGCRGGRSSVNCGPRTKAPASPSARSPAPPLSSYDACNGEASRCRVPLGCRRRADRLVRLRTVTPRATAAPAACGGERWRVKTLGDRPHLLPVQSTTVRFLVTRPRPPSLPDTRLPFERHIFRIIARVAFIRPEADSDLHLGVVDGAGRTMIAEAPLPACAVGATPIRKRQMGIARSRARVCAKAVLTGCVLDSRRTDRGSPERDRAASPARLPLPRLTPLNGSLTLRAGSATLAGHSSATERGLLCVACY